ncbi:MAG: tetratricopeptide repeat protein, partial [Gammaproteobacteria bacterium]
MRSLTVLLSTVSLLFTTASVADDLTDILVAAESDNVQAQLVLGGMHEHGMGVALNDTRSAYWWQRALDNGYIDIAKGLGSMYMSGRGVPLDYERGMELYLFAAEHGHPHAIKFVALGYKRGLGLPQDDEKAAEWAAKAAALDGPNADVVFLDSMQSKETELQTEEQMFAEFLRQANEGNARGFYYVSVAFTSGTGVARNYIEAERWAREAAERGLTSGIRHLGLFHQLGQGVSRNRVEAQKWYYVLDALRPDD